jgi:hypothetical protein
MTSKELGKDCLVDGCEKDADKITEDGDLMVSVCEEHAEAL